MPDSRVPLSPAPGDRPWRTFLPMALLALCVLAAAGCRSSRPPSTAPTASVGLSSPAAGCLITESQVVAMLRQSPMAEGLKFDRIDSPVCSGDWYYTRAVFETATGNPLDEAGFLYHRVGTQLQLVYQGTGPLDPGDPLCHQIPAQIMRAATDMTGLCTS
jgi:hypothetical protein